MKRKIDLIWVKIIMLVLGIGFIFPLFWMLLLSVKDKMEIFSNPFGLPETWIFSNYQSALEAFDYFQALTNSFVYTLGTCAVTLLLGSMVAYAIARTKYRFADQTLFLFTMGLVIPVNVVMIPLYSLVLDLGLKGSAWSLILPYSAFQIPSTVLMLYAFLRGIPTELEEAATLDGAGMFRTFFQIIVPILKPALTTRFVLIYLNIWNEFSLSLVIANTVEMRPLPIALLSFFVESIGVPHWGIIGAAMILCSLPSIIVYCFGNKNIENALTASSGMK